MTPKKLLTICICLLVASFSAAGPALPKKLSLQGNAGLRFTENKGQVLGYDGAAHPEVKYLSSDGNTQVFLLGNALAYQFTKKHYSDPAQGSMRPGRKGIFHPEDMKDGEQQVRTETWRMDMVLAGANANPRMSAAGRSLDYDNYYSRNVMGVHHYDKVTYHDIYPGIDWVIYNENGSMKYDFVVHPGADPSLIRIQFTHHEDLSLNGDGSFTLRNALGSISEQAPLSFQEGRSIASKYILLGNTIMFDLSSHDRSKKLVIDPAVTWATYYGGTGTEGGFSTVADASANVYLAGGTDSYAMIAASGHQNYFAGGNYDAYLVKFNSSGVRQWATYYGGTNHDYAYSCAVDANEEVFISGGTNSTSNIASGGHQNSSAGGTDAFLVKFDSGGGRLWATYYGGFSYEWGSACTVDAFGEVFLSGVTTSQSGIASGGHQNTYGGGTYDAFLVKFTTNGARLWATYYGGNGTEGGTDLEVHCTTDFAGQVYLSGTTTSTTGITLSGHQNFFGLQSDAFLVKFGSSGIRQWGTYYGGSGIEESYECVTDPSGNIYLCGRTNSPNNIGAGGHQTSLSGSFYDDAFLVKFNGSGVRQWGTYYGGSSGDQGFACMTDATDNVYLAGATESYAGIATTGFNDNNQGGGDAFLAMFNPSGARQWGFYYGGYSSDLANSIAVDINGDIFVAGITGSSSEIATSSGHQSTKYGTWDGFLAKFCGGTAPPAPTAISGKTAVCVGSLQTYSVVADPNATSYTWKMPGTTDYTGSNTFTMSPPPFGWNIYLTVVANGTCGSSQPFTTYINVSNSPNVSVSSSAPVYCTGMQAILTASGADTYTWSGGKTGPSHTVSPNTPTHYTVTGSNAAGCVHTVTYSVIPDTTTAFNYTVNGLTAYFAIRNQNCSTFEWDYGNGSGTKINPNPVVTYASAGTYGVCLKCNSLPGACVRCVNLTLPATTSGGVGIPEIQASGILQVYPNPGSGKYKLQLESSGVVEVTSALGQLIMKAELPAGESTIDLGGHANGIYFLQVRNPAAPSSVKIVKE